MTTSPETAEARPQRTFEERHFEALITAARGVVEPGLLPSRVEALRRLIEAVDQERLAMCGEVGTWFPYGSDLPPKFTNHCQLPAGHKEDHDWAQREAAEEARWRGDAARDIGRESRQLGDAGWQRLEDRAVHAGYDRESVRSRRRRDDFTTHTIEVAYDLGLRRAAEVARGRTR